MRARAISSAARCSSRSENTIGGLVLGQPIFQKDRPAPIDAAKVPQLETALLARFSEVSRAS
jgi:hypothetical protein